MKSESGFAPYLSELKKSLKKPTQKKLEWEMASYVTPAGVCDRCKFCVDVKIMSPVCVSCKRLKILNMADNFKSKEKTDE